MSFIENMKKRAKSEMKTIILPEADDIRVLKAAEIVIQEGFANIILIGNIEKTQDIAKQNSIDITNIKIIEPEKSNDFNRYVNEFYELRKNKGMTQEKAKEFMLDPIYFGTMMVKLEEADGLVSGAAHSTADTLRPALQILKTAPRY